MKQSEITKHWVEAGTNFPKIHKQITPTSRDPYLGILERNNIIAFLKSKDRVLEIGCGDSNHTIQYAKKVKEVHALDIADTLLKRAQKNVKKAKIQNIHFQLGSATEVANFFSGIKFDAAISQRCLINIANWESQKNVIKQIHQKLVPGGRFLLSEGFVEGFGPLNKLRKQLGLDLIRPVLYNNNFARKRFESFIKEYFEIIDIRDYGFYLLFSRTVTSVAFLPKKPEHDCKINEAIMKLSQMILSKDFSEFSYNFFYALKKK